LSSFFNELLSAGEHSLEYAARPCILAIFVVSNLKLGYPTIRLTFSLLSALPKGMNRDIGYLEGHLDLFNLMSSPSHVIVFIQRVNDDQFWGQILN
jgi:hypothetical protein